MKSLDKRDILWMIAYKAQRRRQSADEIYDNLLKQMWGSAKMGQMTLIATVGPAVEKMLEDDGFQVIRFVGQKYDNPCLISWDKVKLDD